MCVRKTALHEATSEEPNDGLTDRLIELSNAGHCDRIIVAGHKTLGVMLGLCRRGFRKADCRLSADGPHVTDDCADCLWILHARDAAEMRTLLASCGRDLVADGMLVIQLDSGLEPDRAARLGDVLAKCGFIQTQTRATDGEILLCARKRAANTALAA